MGLVMRETGTGLVLAEEAADEARLSHAVKQIDPRLVLQKHPADVAGGWVYKVFCIVSEDEPAVCVLTWCDRYGNPLPLSSGLVDELQRLRPEARTRRGPDVDERNEQLVERRRKQTADDNAAIIGEHKARITRGQVVVGMGPRPKAREWQRRRL